MLNEYEVNSRELVLGVVGSLAIMIQNLGVEAFGTRIIPHISNIFSKWPGDSEIFTQVAHIFFYINHSPRCEELLLPVSSGVMHGLKNTLFSKYPGTLFQENEPLVKAVIPLVALFTWIGTPQSLLVLNSAKTFYILAEILRLYSQFPNICHNVINIIYGCLERSDTDVILSTIANVAYHLIPVLTKNMKIYSRHKNIVTLSVKIFKTLELDETCSTELHNCGTMQLLEN